MNDQMRFAPPEGDVPPATPAAVTTTPVVPVVAPKKRGGGLTNAVFAIAALVAVGGLSFAVGRATAPATTAAGAGRTAAGFPAGGPAGSFDPGAARGGFAGDRTVTLSGTVKSIDGSTLVITAADGTERTIDVSGSTYHAQAAATAADVTAGDTVQVSVDGFGGFRPGNAPGASAAPAGSGAPAAGTGTITATNVTITGGQ